MADDPRPPVAIRVTRPYTSEDEYLEHELETLTRTSVTLLGAPPRPSGQVLRFELGLASGAVLVRGEGRVVGFKPHTHQGVSGLTLRFTRLDSRSKALIDKAATLRDRRRPPSINVVWEDTAGPQPSSAPAEEHTSSVRGSPAPPEPLSSSFGSLPPPQSPSPSSGSLPPPEPPSSRSGASSAPPEPPPPEPPGRPEETEFAPSLAEREVEPIQSNKAPPPGRDELLERLRARARALDPTSIQRILEQRGRA